MYTLFIGIFLSTYENHQISSWKKVALSYGLGFFSWNTQVKFILSFSNLGTLFNRLQQKNNYAINYTHQVDNVFQYEGQSSAVDRYKEDAMKWLTVIPGHIYIYLWTFSLHVSFDGNFA